MKTLVSFILISLFLFASYPISSQVTYRVIKVNGSIIYVRTGNSMTQGDIFDENENLSFQSPNSRAAVINPSTGRFILTPDNYDDLSSAKSNFLPAMSNLSTRGGIINNLNDLQNQFCDNIVLLCEASYYLNPYQFPMNENQFFFLKFQHKGEEINKKLGYEENRLILSRENILKVDEEPIDKFDHTDISLYYYKDEQSEYISDFSLIIPELDEVKTELQIILDESAEKSYNQKVNDISAYLFEFYGKPDKQDVIDYLEKTFGLVR
ncbi:MAG: hypothetical protein AMS27_08245 [Bacteroides sp. SM23_62_1]|nr:MAG: hypothetical protein AMS27_08245 [Bacteroides sp. SM23_62_1]